MIKIFVDFIRENFDVKDEEWRININCYLNDGLTIDDIQKYWLNFLKLPKECMRSFVIRNRYYNNNNKQKYPYGICRVRIHRTDVVQQIYGSIKEYANISDDNLWL